MTRPAPVCVCIFLTAVRLHCLWKEPSCYEETEDGFPYIHPFSYTDCTRHDSRFREEHRRILPLLSKGSPDSVSHIRIPLPDPENLINQSYRIKLHNKKWEALMFQDFPLNSIMQEMGSEPTRYRYHRHLKPARLPIPPLLRTDRILHDSECFVKKKNYKHNKYFSSNSSIFIGFPK